MNKPAQRRHDGYRTDTRHGILGSLTVYDLMGIIGSFLMGMEAGKRLFPNASTQTLFAVGCAILAFLAVMAFRRQTSKYPKRHVHFWQFWSGYDRYEIQPDQKPIPLRPFKKEEQDA
ncbi:hypothetical protein [Deinococcus cellulosilyticus]|nr:hypothetical protein [Deinococcus cellulosilyticus]